MFNITDSYGFVLAKVVQRLEAALQPALDEFSLMPKHFGTLVIIDEHPGLTQKRIGSFQQIDRTSIGQIVDHLVKCNLVKRTPDASDRRAYSLSLTTQGTQCLLILWKAKEAAEHQVLKQLTAKERTLFLSLAVKAMEETEDAITQKDY